MHGEEEEAAEADEQENDETRVVIEDKGTRPAPAPARARRRPEGLRRASVRRTDALSTSPTRRCRHPPDGKAINVIDNGVTLTQDLRTAAVSHLHGLQSQVAALMSRLYG